MRVQVRHNIEALIMFKGLVLHLDGGRDMVLNKSNGNSLIATIGFIDNLVVKFAWNKE